MAVYIDKRVIVTGGVSNIDAHNPFNLTKFVQENCCSPDRTGTIGGILPGNLPPATPWNPIRVPRPMNQWVLESIEIQTTQTTNLNQNDFQVVVGSFSTEMRIDVGEFTDYKEVNYTVTEGELVSVELTSLDPIDDVVLILNLRENV